MNSLFYFGVKLGRFDKIRRNLPTQNFIKNHCTVFVQGFPVFKVLESKKMMAMLFLKNYVKLNFFVLLCENYFIFNIQKLAENFYCVNNVAHNKKKLCTPAELYSIFFQPLANDLSPTLGEYRTFRGLREALLLGRETPLQRLGSTLVATTIM